MGGVDPVWLLTCDDPIASRAAQLAARRRIELEQRRDENLSVMTANAVWKGFGG